MIRSSPGGQVLQDYHWSGGLYSNQFNAYDKWGRPDTHLYGTPSNYTQPIQNWTPLQQIGQVDNITNYELLSTPAHTEAPISSYPFDTTKLGAHGFKEMFTLNNNQNIILSVFLMLIFIYLLDKTLGNKIFELNIYIKIIILVIIFILLIVLCIF